jgi:hypothetical protein
MAGGFPLPAFCIIPSQHLLAEVDKLKAQLRTNIPSNGMARTLEAHIGQVNSWEVQQLEGDLEEVVPWAFFPGTQMTVW